MADTVLIEDQTVFIESLEADMHLKNCRIDSRGFRKLLTDVTFTNCDFLIRDFSRTEWLDCVFSNCDFSNFSFAHAVLYRDQWTTCKMVGTDFSQTSSKDSRFKDCLMTYASFPDATLTNINFESCQLNESFFQHVQLKNVVFKQSHLEQADFSETLLKGVDWSSCTIDGIRIDMPLAVGLKIDAFQAAPLVASLGIEITGEGTGCI
ncbi:pentapeptide repeat-containing protein [Sporolactobacillus spathodeae]|uniref:Uncharacterized protein YjbI with pentapeptide repeats n=1 Tax=Sporolactobacillus spathodeae TaxID=1465502 RepID=A0ABS2Q7H1_9BACL|nr:pentapeptide repeat-containing protein [Sporolactobacillus spathodeae]MBM7657688.1 uncharacterized protein YjbI with pentapeptide repeats [Sporolactobacillus spathodeae]